MSNKHTVFIWIASDPLINQKVNFNGTVVDLRELRQSAVEASSKNTVLREIMKYILNL